MFGCRLFGSRTSLDHTHIKVYEHGKWSDDCEEGKTMTIQKAEFLRNEFLTMSILGALGRSNTYSKSALAKDKECFRTVLREMLDRISWRYESAVTEEEHLAIIKGLSDDMTSRFSHCLNNGRFRIGIAQKAMNLYLKYLWCAGFLETPPHCPFDSIVIAQLSECRDLNWTSIDSIEDYKRLVLATKKASGSMSLDEWEYNIWLDGMQINRKAMKTDRSETENTEAKGVVKPISSPIIEGGAIVCTGKITSQGKYADGKDICEIYIHKINQDVLPHEKGEPKEITLIIGKNAYFACVRETSAKVVWISSRLYEKTPRREKVRLVNVLEKIGLKKGDKVRIIASQDGTFSLEPL